jgi:hypothetical protein
MNWPGMLTHMSNPTKPDIDYSYAGFQAEQQDFPFPGTQLDNDLAELETSIDQTIDALIDIRRADGALNNGIVTADSLAEDLLIGLKTPTVWETSYRYVVLDCITSQEPTLQGVYRCIVSHESTDFTDDLDAGYWELIFLLSPDALGLAPVALTGVYADLIEKPSLGTAAAQNVEAFQAADADLAAIAALASAADKMPYSTGAGAWALADLTSLGRSLLAGTTAAGMRGTLGLGGAAVLDVGTTAGTVAAGDDGRIAGAAQRASLKLNVLDFGADKTGVANSSAAFTAAYTAAVEGQSIVVPEGQYNLVTGVSGTKNVYWEVEGFETLLAFNWSDILPGVVVQTGKRDLTAGIPTTIVSRTDVKGLGLTTANSVDYMSIDISDDIQSSAGRINGLVVYNRGKAGAKGIRQTLTGYSIIEATPGVTPGGGYWVGLQGYSGAVAPASISDAVHGMNGYAELKAGATGYQNVTGGEDNAGILTGASALFRSGRQIAGFGNVRGSVTDAAVYISNLANATVTWKNGVEFGNANGAMPLGADSTAFKFTGTQTFDKLIDLGSAVVGTYFTAAGALWTPTSFQLLGTNQTFLLGNRTSANTPTLRGYSSGNTTSDVNLVFTGGTGADDGTLTASLGLLQIGGNTQPTTNATKSFGATALRWLMGWFVNITLSPGIGTVITPATNGDLTFEFSSNTSIKIKGKGSDGTVRSVTMTLV